MIQLKEINQTNYEKCAMLKTTDDQRHFVSPNWYSLLEANYEKQRRPFGIYAEDEMVGFIMYSYYEADEDYPLESWWLERFMIDHRFQKKGYGSEALQKSIQWFEETIGADELRISAVPSNDVALKLYESLSFVRTGEDIAGENVLLRRWR